MLAPQILAFMLSLGPAPGASPYSVIETTETAKPCPGHRPLCRRPWFSVWHRSLVRQENRAEGLARYWVIAKAIEEVSATEHMERVLFTITLHESGWRRDVHSGKGPDARGDGGRSWGLVQALLGRYSRQGPRIVGVGPEATRRALGWAATHIARCRAGEGDPIALFGCYGGVKEPARHRGILARASTYQKLAADPPLLAADVCKALDIEPLQAHDGDVVRLCQE